MANYITGIKSRTRRVSLPDFFSGFDSSKDEGVLPIVTAKRIYNFDISSGALREGWGLKDAGITAEGVTNVWQYRRFDPVAGIEIKKTMYSVGSGEVYCSSPHGYTALAGVKFSSTPFAANYRLYGEDVILMCSRDGMYVWNGTDAAYKVENAPKITSLTMHFERMFVSTDGEKNTVWFSDDLDPTNWNADLKGGGFIQMIDENGGVNRVVSFLNYVYVLRDRGISRITAFADQSEFSAVNLFVSSGKIYGGSAAVCGDTLLFLAEDGLYGFDGLSTRRIAPALCGMMRSSPSACGAYYDGKYFAALRIDSDGDENNAFLVYDLKTGTLDMTEGVCVKAFCPTDSELFAVTDSGVGAVERSGEIFGVPTPKRWESGMLDFGTDEVKTVKEFCVDASAPFVLTVSSERGEKKFSVVPKNGLTSVRVNLSGRKISFSLCSSSKIIRIARPFLRISY